jgi:putative copper export protein
MAGSVWVGGLATLLEKKSRRMELALYVLSRWVGVCNSVGLCVWGL